MAKNPVVILSEQNKFPSLANNIHISQKDQQKMENDQNTFAEMVRLSQMPMNGQSNQVQSTLREDTPLLSNFWDQVGSFFERTLDKAVDTATNPNTIGQVAGAFTGMPPGGMFPPGQYPTGQFPPGYNPNFYQQPQNAISTNTLLIGGAVLLAAFLISKK